jgi:hypothetical protein
LGGKEKFHRAKKNDAAIFGISSKIWATKKSAAIYFFVSTHARLKRAAICQISRRARALAGGRADCFFSGFKVCLYRIITSWD